MTKTFKRQELYNLVWSTPMRELVKEYGISDRGMAKACAKAGIPVPERGYWNKLQAGKKVSAKPLPPRGIGMSDEVIIGGGSYWHGYRNTSDDDIRNNPVPPEPVFEEDMAVVRERAEKLVARARFPKNLQQPHRHVARLLQQDQERIQKKLQSRWPSVFDDAWFDSPLEQRRLKVINALYTALENCGFQPSSTRKEGRDLGVRIGDCHIGFTIDDVNAKDDNSYMWLARDKKPAGTRMRFRMSVYQPPEDIRTTWEDQDDDKIENHLRAIAIELIVAAESFYRAGEIRHRDWLIERKAELEEKERQRILEEERKAREHKIRLKQQRIDHLLGQATALRQATEIRTYVEAVRVANAASQDPVPPAAFRGWSEWALAQADRIDPVRSGAFRIRPDET